MKKILIVTALFPPEPVVSANLSFDLAESLCENNCVTVVCPRPSRPLGYTFHKGNKRSHTDNYKVVEVNSYVSPQSKVLGRLCESISFGLRCLFYVYKNKSNIDIIYANTWPLFAQLFLVIIAKLTKKKLLIHIQDIYPESVVDGLTVYTRFFFNVLFYIDKYIVLNSFKIITISNKMKGYLIQTRKIDSEKIEVVYNWQDESKFIDIENTKFKNIQTDFVFMYLGTLNATSRVDVIIESFIKSNIKNAKLIVAGSGSEKINLVKIALENSKIEFCDAPVEMVPQLQSNADVLILSLKRGGAKYALPSKLVAYMLSKKTLIASVDLDSEISSIIKNAECGYVVASENCTVLSECMLSVFNESKESLKQKGGNAYIYAIQNLSREINMSKLVTIIEES